MVGAELRLIAAPSGTYARLARRPLEIGMLRALRRPALVALVLGGSTAMMGTRHATPALVMSTTLCWTGVVIVQIAIALGVIAGPARRTVGIPRALDLFFASHAPWSLYMLAVVAWAPTAADASPPFFAAAGLPFIWTALLITAFFREVLELDPRAAIGRAAVHQAITWSLFLLIYGSAVGLIPRIVQWIG